jgi:hypothetical protein
MKYYNVRLKSPDAIEKAFKFVVEYDKQLTTFSKEIGGKKGLEFEKLLGNSFMTILIMTQAYVSVLKPMMERDPKLKPMKIMELEHIMDEIFYRNTLSGGVTFTEMSPSPEATKLNTIVDVFINKAGEFLDKEPEFKVEFDGSVQGLSVLMRVRMWSKLSTFLVILTLDLSKATRIGFYDYLANNNDATYARTVLLIGEAYKIVINNRGTKRRISNERINKF